MKIAPQAVAALLTKTVTGKLFCDIQAITFAALSYSDKSITTYFTSTRYVLLILEATCCNKIS